MLSEIGSDDFSVKPVDMNNWDEFEKFFSAKGSPNYCWCMAFRMTREELKNNNSICRKEYIKQRIHTGIPVGVLVYEKNVPIAWCSVAPRETFNKIGSEDNLNDVWSISCLFIKRDFRKKGLTNLLIEYAKKYARENKAKYLEAYAVSEDSPSYRHMGVITLYEKAGFTFVEKLGKRRNIMRYEL